jgi:hypothetical protein
VPRLTRAQIDSAVPATAARRPPGPWVVPWRGAAAWPQGAPTRARAAVQARPRRPAQPGRQSRPARRRSRRCRAPRARTIPVQAERVGAKLLGSSPARWRATASPNYQPLITPTADGICKGHLPRRRAAFGAHAWAPKSRVTHPWRAPLPSPPSTRRALPGGRRHRAGGRPRTTAEEDRAIALAQVLADFERLMASWADAPEPDAGRHPVAPLCRRRSVPPAITTESRFRGTAV